MGDAGLGRIGSRLDVAEEGRRVRPHRRQVAAHDSCRPTSRSRPPIVPARPCRQTPNSRGSGEGFRRFRRAVAARRDERVAVGDVQLRQSLVRSGEPPGARAAPPRRLVRHGDRLAEMGDRLLEGRAAQRLVAGLAPPFDRKIVEAGLREMMGDRFGFGRCAVAQDLGGPARAAPGGGS